MSAKSTTAGTSKFHRSRSTATKKVLSQQATPNIDFASSSSPLSPGWVSGSNAVFLTPHSPSPRRPNTRSRRSSVYAEKPTVSGVAKSKIPQNTNNRRRGFKIPALPIVFSPGGVKTRARRSSIYQTSTSRVTTVSTVTVREMRMFEQEEITVSEPMTYQSPTQSSLNKQRSPVFSPLKMSKKINIPSSPLIKQDRNVKASKKLAPKSRKSVTPKVHVVKEVKADNKSVEKVSPTAITPKSSPAKTKKRQARKSPKTESTSENRTKSLKSPSSTPKRQTKIADKKTKSTASLKQTGRNDAKKSKEDVSEVDSIDNEMMDTDSDSIDDEIIFTPQKHEGTSDSSTTASSNSTSAWTVTKNKTPQSTPSTKKQRKTSPKKLTPKIDTSKSTPRQKTTKSSALQQEIHVPISLSPPSTSSPPLPKTPKSATTARKTPKSTTPRTKAPKSAISQTKSPKSTTPVAKTPKSTASLSTAAKSSSSKRNRSKSSTPKIKTPTSRSSSKSPCPNQQFYTPKLATASQRATNSFHSPPPLHELPLGPINARKSPPTPRHLVVKKPVTLQKLVLMKNTPRLESPKRLTKRKSLLDSEDEYSSPRLMFEDMLQRRDHSPFGTPSTPGIFESSRKKPRRESNEMYKIITPLKNRTNNSLIRTLGSSAYSTSDSIADISDMETMESSTYTYNYSDRINIDNDNRKWCTIL